MGQPVDARSDLFSLGCLLYRMATGEAPFKGSDPLEIIAVAVSATHAHVLAKMPDSKEVMRAWVGLASPAQRALEREDPRRQVLDLPASERAGCLLVWEDGRPVARVEGPLPSILTAERTALNFLGHLSGVATLTRRYVRVIAFERFNEQWQSN